MKSFHLSLAVKSMEESVDFFVNVLGSKVLHRDPSGYVNIDFFGNQISLKHEPEVVPNLPEFHFGVNLSLQEFDEVSKNILANHHQHVHRKPEVWDAGTAIERKKMYLKCPTGYLVELKGYR